MERKARKIAVIGAGTMGCGIAQLCLSKEFEICLVDKDSQVLASAQKQIAKQFARGIEKGRHLQSDVHRWLAQFATNKSMDVVADADVVIEAIFEDIHLKKSVWAQISKSVSSETLLASNTSCLSIDSMAEVVEKPERFLGLHFFNPAPVMKLLEIVRGNETSDQCLERGKALAETLGKDFIVVKDSPGFATSRLGNAFAVEAMRMVETGVASASDIDKAMKLGYGHPMGPLELTDLVGLDVRKNILGNLSVELEAPHLKPPKVLQDLVAAGKLGKKTGQGFYDWREFK